MNSEHGSFYRAIRRRSIMLGLTVTAAAVAGLLITGEGEPSSESLTTIIKPSACDNHSPDTSAHSYEVYVGKDKRRSGLKDDAYAGGVHLVYSGNPTKPVDVFTQSGVPVGANPVHYVTPLHYEGFSTADGRTYDITIDKDTPVYKNPNVHINASACAVG